MKSQSLQSVPAALTTGTIAGLAGGGAEIGWITLYGSVSGTPVVPVARGIVEALIPAWGPSAYTIPLGILIHLGLAVLLGNVLALAMRFLGRSWRTAAAEFVWVVSMLAAVWAVNFFVVLPQLSPAFVHLLPYGITLVSKLLFGVAAAAVFRAQRARPGVGYAFA